MKKVSLHQRLLRGRLWRISGGLTATALLLSTQSCSSVGQYVRNPFSRSETSVAKSDTEKKSVQQADVGGANSAVAKAGESGLVNATESKVVEAKKTTSTSALASKTSKAASPFDMEDPFASQVPAAKAEPQIQQTAAVEAITPREPTGVSPIHHEQEPRIGDAGAFACPPVNCPPVDCPTGVCPPAKSCPPVAGQARPFPAPEYIGDEFVCDGGDKGLPVHYEGQMRAGLGLEDTVAEYVDHEGVQHMKPSTEVCIYAPRFGAVRTATGVQQDLTVEKAAGHQDRTKLAEFDAKAVLDEKVQTDEAGNLRIRSRVSGFESLAADDKLDQAVAAARHIKIQNAFEDIQFFREGLFDRVDIAVVEAAIAAAVEWSDGRVAVVIAHDQSGHVVQARSTPQDMTGIEDRRQPGNLRIVKIADRGVAHPGDVVTFTIRFDNVGDRELHGVRVIDNLSPRLEFIEGSVDSNLDGEVDVEDNGAGSKLLTFEFDKPLEGKTGGFVSFKCRLR